jgi:polygalacturonase
MQMKIYLVLLLSWTFNIGLGASQPFYDVKNFGAVPDGQTLATAAIQKAVDACAADGGGKVVIPSGRYLTGPIFLKSYVQVEIEPGAILVGSTNFADYPVIEGRWEGIERKIYSSLFTGQGLTHVSITGHGTLDGQGAVWWAANRATGERRRQAGLVGREPDNPSDAPLPWPRARMIYLQSCTNVLLRDLTILNSPSWNVHPVYCEHVTLDNLTIISPANSPNTDAVDPDSCRDVRILNCYCDVGDDDIVIKSGYNEDGRRVGIPCEDILVNNCTLAHGNGGVVIGSEMSGSVRNVTVANCVFDGTLRGLRVKTAMGRGGVIENFRASNLVMRNIVESAFSITSNYDGPRGARTNTPAPESIPVMRHIHWSDVIVAGTRNVAELNGLADSMLEDVSLRNIQVTSAKTGIHCENAKGVRLENIDFQPDSGSALDARNVSDLEVLRLAIRQPNPGVAVISLKDVSGGLLRDCRVPAGPGVFLNTSGSANKDIVCELNRLATSVKLRGP